MLLVNLFFVLAKRAAHFYAAAKGRQRRIVPALFPTLARSSSGFCRNGFLVD